MVIRATSLLSIGFACAASPACDAPADSVEGSLGISEYRRVAELPSKEGQPPALLAPDTVEAGLPFRVQVTTAVGGCTRGGEVEVERGADRITFRPYTYERAGDNFVCSPYRAYDRREISLQLTRPGAVWLRVHGQQRDPNGRRIPHTVERRVVVREPEGYQCYPPHFTSGCR